MGKWYRENKVKYPGACKRKEDFKAKISVIFSLGKNK